MREAEPQLSRAIFNSLETGLILLDSEHRVVSWNAWFAAMCGTNPDVAAGRSLKNLFPDCGLERLNAAIAAAFSSGVSSLSTHSLHPALFRLRTRAGRTLIHDVMVRPVGAAPAAGCLIQVVDVTVAAERERVLRERQNARYDAVVASAPDLIVTIDANGIIQYANPAAWSQLGYASKELEGRPAGDLFTDKSQWAGILRAVLAGEAISQPIEIDARRKDGGLNFLEVSLSRWRGDSRTFVTAILRDVNERRAAERARNEASRALVEMNATLEQRIVERTGQLMQAEEALRQSHKMEAVGQLTGGIAHDFNNLLQGIIGSLSRVQKCISEGKIGETDRFLEGALASAHRAAALTNRLLAFSRRQPVDPRPVNVNHLIATVEELLRRSLGENIRMTIAGQEDLWLVRCDINQLENALLNLAINSRDAMPDGGTLTIETANLTLERKQHELEAGDYVRIRVKDSGVGMSSEVKARAFDPFYTTKPIGQGTGLGLSMIYGFVRQSDGIVRIESEVGSGTMVEILLPRFHGDQSTSSVADDSGGDLRAGHNEVVLVVEDEGLIRLLIVDVLDELNYYALEAADGAAALRILQSSQRIDLLVTDIGLPGLNGRQLADAAREHRPDLKILFMTGYAENAAGKSFLETGMEIITKPFDMNVLAARIKDMIENAPRV